MEKRVIIIDDEELIVDAVREILRSFDIHVDGFSDPEEGLNAAISNPYDLYLLDLRMPHLNGSEICQKILEVIPEAKVLIITAFPMDPLAIEAMEAGAIGLLKKPFEIAKIIAFLGM